MIQGVTFSVIASFGFAAIYYYASLFTAMSGQLVFGWRIFATALCLSALVAFIPPLRKSLVAAFSRIRQQPAILLTTLLCSLLLGVQLWLFMWAPLHQKALEVSLGYLLLPHMMALVGLFIFKERMSKIQKIAILTALIGVLSFIFILGYVSWATLLVAIGYPVYFSLKRIFRTQTVGNLWLEIALMLPLALWFIQQTPNTFVLDHSHQYFYLLVVGLGLLSALCIMFFGIASDRLPFTLFGLLSYLEPVLLVMIAFLLGESIKSEQLFGYSMIFLSVLLLVIEGLKLFLTPKLISIRLTS